MVSMFKRGYIKLAALLVAMLFVSCGGKEGFIVSANTETFTQSFNPPYVDILFVLNDRSPMHDAQDHIVSEAQAFFSRLDGIPDQYRLGVTNHAAGKLLPADSPYILEKKNGVGTPEERANIFRTMLANTLNLRTSAVDQGLLSGLLAVNQLQPRANVPLVIVFISDSDDHSSLPVGETDAIDYYKRAYLSTKGNQADLLRVYSINLVSPRNSSNRCTAVSNNDIDNGGFQDRYFRFANIFGASNVTADLCGSFSSLIDLSGLRQLELPKRFKLAKVPNPSSLVVSVVPKGGDRVEAPFSFDTSTNEVVFAIAPPEGSSITVTFDVK